MKFRKRPVVIDAVKWLGTNSDEIDDFMGTNKSWDPINGGLFIHTLEGVMKANPGDWIIKGVKGEVYPCKPVIFEMTYEACTPSNIIKLPKMIPDEECQRLLAWVDSLELQEVQELEKLHKRNQSLSGADSVRGSGK